MKNIFATLLIATMSLANAQVIIGDQIGTAPANQKTSVLLEFAAGQNKGIILPYLRTLPQSPSVGTIALDATNSTSARVKFYNGAWVDLSGQDGDITTVLATQPTTGDAPELATAKSIIGARTSAADGVLVLESTTKAMVLPTVTSVQNIPNPAPGMMVYVNNTGAKRLAVFNGTRWSYWKP